MPLLILVAYFVLEIYSIRLFSENFGAVNTLFALLAGAVLGFGILRSQGRMMLTQMQRNLARGLAPADDVLHGILIFMAGLLFIIPGFFSDLLAIAFLVPGLRHVSAFFIRRLMGRMISRGQFRVFTYGTGPFGRGQGAENGESFERDVSPRVIDVKPISSVHDQGDHHEKDS